MTIDALKVAGSRYGARTVAEGIQLLDYNGQEVPEVVRTFDEAGAVAAAAALAERVRLAPRPRPALAAT